MDGKIARWAGLVRVDDSYAFRIRLDQVRLHAGSKVWLYSPSNPELELGPFGSQLLVTAVSGDVTLVRLNAQPPTAYRLLGWTTADPADGATLLRQSHPAGSHMRLTGYQLNRPSTFQCSGNYNPAFAHYSTNSFGSTPGGSSGSAVVNESGQIVGQLQGSCGDDADLCDFDAFATVDGKFSVNYPRLVQWLNPTNYNSDLVVQEERVNATNPEYGQNLFPSAAVRNNGYEPSSSTTLRYYRSSNSIISTSDAFDFRRSLRALIRGQRDREASQAAERWRLR